MANYSEREAEEARRIIEGLLARQYRDLDIEASLVVSDIEFDAAEFTEELQILEEFDLKVPAFRVGEELVPVALSLIAGPALPFSPVAGGYPPRWLDEPFFYEWARRYFRSILIDRGRIHSFETLSLDNARSTFVRRATDFLATRMAALHNFEDLQSNRWSSVSFLNVLQRVGGTRVAAPGCSFNVSTNSGGLRVFWSGAYRVSPNYFSHPTSPARGVLQSGTYVFGVDGGAYGNQIQWDLNAVVTLPGAPNVHLNY